jgi:hypothetical protein
MGGNLARRFHLAMFLPYFCISGYQKLKEYRFNSPNMRILSILAFITLGLIQSVLAQLDITTARANPKTFIFDDEKHTVHGYIYSTLKEQSSCCGNDAIYLEVKFDQTGAVTSAKTLTGKSDCYKKTIVDIVQNVKWDATGLTGSKTIYFEVKPIIPCSGLPGENVYKALHPGGAVAGNVPPAPDPPTSEEKTEAVANVPPKKEEPPVAVKETKKVEEDFLSDDTVKKAENPPVASAKPTKTEPVKEPVKVVPAQPMAKKTPKPSPAKTNPSGSIKIPPQEKIPYVSKGDAKPQVETHSDIDIKGTSLVTYADETTFGMNLRFALRKAGYCGLAQALVELETDPKTGKVINSRIMQVNDAKVAELVPTVIKDLKFRPSVGAANRYVYSEFKTEIVCEGQKPKYDLDQVSDFLSKPEANNGQ